MGMSGVVFCISVTLLGHYLVLQMFVAVLTFTLQNLTTTKLQEALDDAAEREASWGVGAAVDGHVKKHKRVVVRRPPSRVPPARH
eukprot:6322786-Prymnesium_polylepis.1